MNSITQHIRPAKSADTETLLALVRDCVATMLAAGIE